jgi:succinate-semialdehyde dehydrogenase/glutarate-semialdehyde dehydrogenase
MFIGGQSVDSGSNQTYEIRNPADGTLIDSVPKGNREDAKRAIDAAEDAFKKWRWTSAEERSNILFKGIESTHANIDDLALLLCKEQGKPVKHAVTEIEHFLHGMTFYARLAPTVRGSYVSLPDTKMYGMVLKQPIGVCAAISPWNFPITLMGTRSDRRLRQVTRSCTSPPARHHSRQHASSNCSTRVGCLREF